jgi:perosamine synthetase
LDLKGGEVLVPSNTFVASANAVYYAGGKPVFAEIEPDNLWVSFSDLKKKITSRTRAIMLVHLGGVLSEDLKAILRYAKQKKIPVIEDCAHTVGYPAAGSVQPGKLSLAGAFSFWPTKILTTGTGGMLTTSSKALAEYAHSLRFHGLGHNNLRNIIHFGNDWSMNEILACVGVEQLALADEVILKRKKVFSWYQKELSAVPQVRIPSGFFDPLTTFYKFWVTFKTPVPVLELNRLMNERFQVQTEFLYWPPVPAMPLYQKKLGVDYRKFPKTHTALMNHLCLPMHPALREKDVAYVTRSLKKSLEVLRGGKP